MHPVIAQAIAAEQARELQAHAAAARRTRQHRRSLHARLLPRLRAQAPQPTAWPRRGPRAACTSTFIMTGELAACPRSAHPACTAGTRQAAVVLTGVNTHDAL